MQDMIGFISFTDFLAELSADSPQDQAVRVQAMVSTRGNPATAKYQIVVSANLECSHCWAVCKFELGDVLAVFQHEPIGKRYRQNVQTASDLLAHALQQEGYKIRGGVPIGYEQMYTVTSCDLWRFEREDDLPLLVTAQTEDDHVTPTDTDS